ncbi:MAG: hypothetical protein U1D55_12070 [Phycisphaerae bacterium]
MIAEAIRETLEHETIHPIRVRASSGESYVRKPGLVVLLKTEVLNAEPNSDRWSALVPTHPLR